MSGFELGELAVTRRCNTNLANNPSLLSDPSLLHLLTYPDLIMSQESDADLGITYPFNEK
jgi:hypothetical protein